MDEGGTTDADALDDDNTEAGGLAVSSDNATTALLSAVVTGVTPPEPHTDEPHARTERSANSSLACLSFCCRLAAVVTVRYRSVALVRRAASCLLACAARHVCCDP